MKMEPLEPLEKDDDGFHYQLRVRITAAEKDALEKIRLQHSNTSISKLVREALALLLEKPKPPSSNLEQKIFDLAALLKREPSQVEAACLEGIFDLIENKSKVPLIVMEAQLYHNYANPAH